ncbi:MAG: radical SAM protein [archaeon]
MKTYQNTFDELTKKVGNVNAWKIAALFFGVRDENQEADPLNPYRNKRAGFSMALNLEFGGIAVKAPRPESMIGANYSPIIFDGRQLFNEITQNSISAQVSQKILPAGVRNLAATSSGTIEVMVFPGCSLFDYGKECTFCIVGPTIGKDSVSGSTILSELELMITAGIPLNNVTLNTGQPREPGRDLQIIGEIAKQLKEAYPQVKIAAEVAPFSFVPRLSALEAYLNSTGLSNVDTFMINVEMVSDLARKILCPGKPSLDKYRQTIFGLSDLGYQVTTVIQMNYLFDMEPIEGVANFVYELSDKGSGLVAPELLVSRAVPSSNIPDEYWQSLSVPMAKEDAQMLMFGRFEEFLERSAYVNRAVVGARLDSYRAKAGCVLCNGCGMKPEIRCD